MSEQLFKVPVVTNDYNFLFRFALASSADYIQVIESDDIVDSFNFCFYDQEDAVESQKFLNAFVRR